MLEIIREYSFDVNFETGKFKRTDGSEERIKLVQNDNESTKFKFNFEEEIADNTNVLVRLRQSTGYVKEYTMLVQNQEAEIILANDILSASGSIKMSITLIGTNNEILTAIEYFEKIEVKKCLEGNTEIPEQEKNVLVDLISQVNSLNQTASQLVEDSEAAVQNANTATTNANTATQNANTATSNANQAAQNANNAVTELDNRLATKVDKVNGKGLSTNDYDNAEKEKNETNRTEILRRALITETGNKIDLEINNQTYILTAKLYDKNNNLISTSTSIDLPLETMIVNATYNNTAKKIVLTLQSGTTVEFSIADLIDGLVNETTFNETIEELEAENTRLKQRVADLENNELTNTVSGESIDIDDSANATIRNIKITGKSVQDGTPTPENPVEIQNCSDSINFKAENKNLAWNGWAEDFVSRINDNTKAKLETKDGRNCLFFSANAGYGDYDNKYIFKTNWKEDTQYTISFSEYITSQNQYGNIEIQYTDGTNTEVSGLTSNVWNNVIKTSSANKTIKYIKVHWRSGDNWIDLDTFMVEENTTASTYTSHQEQNITFPLQEGQVLAQDDYLADDGIHHIRRTIEITSENIDTLLIGLQSYNSMPVVIIPKYILGWQASWSESVALINRYKKIIYTNEVASGTFATNFYQAYLSIFDERFTSLEVAKELLIGTVIEIKQAQEIIEPYTEQQAQVWKQIKALRTYKNITHISSEDETKPTLEVTYVRDLQTVINNMQAQILS